MRNERISGKAISHNIGLLLNWWRDELISLLPPQLSRPLQYRDHQLVCSFGASGVELVDCRHGKVERRVNLTPGDPDELDSAQQAQLAELQHQSGGQVVIRLQPDQVLPLSFSLPLEAETNLDEVLGYELGRHAPFKIEQVYYGYTIAERRNAEKKIWLSVTVVPRKQVDPLLEKVRHWGLNPVAVTAVVPGEAADAQCRTGGLNLLPQAQRGHGGGTTNMAVRVLVLTACLLCVLVGGYPLLMQRMHIAELQQEVSAVKKMAVSVQSMQQEMERLAGEAAFVDEKKNRYPEVLAVLKELTRLLPDDTWLERFEMKEERIRIQGMSEDASPLIELLENSPLMQNVSFDSPIVKDTRTERFRFQIVAELMQGGAQ